MPIVLLVIFFVLIIIVPLLVLWALNTLFGFGIDYTIWTWLAVVILVSVIRTKIEVTKS